ncbi:acetyl-CoA carboxylase biotin carboxyl carrier protein [Hymenobacter sp. BT188]|uniref:acetyl-CoA carboxylase biotin carboxyl carrier protein n=1 Tax=Hymenobacter sp. BT188 TaxID=2763504 RepID=UPI0016519D99|nr:acetyl-CoA carboxylase biotin carboxyl carrier protein [Hymenobacter sp. BT188]MBC6607805.1 acetyl-CoA carboxylase biotin carboxyl carrier protein [Hymenobacter sp. BT188]
MKAKELQELLDFIAKSGLNKVNIETEEFKISVQRDPSYKPVISSSMSAPAPAAAPQVPAPVAAPVSAPAPTTTTPATTSEPSESNYQALKAPMIGTFYRSNSPDSPAFVNVGDTVEKGQVICIIEAMKLFNEIEAEASGRIVKALVENSSPVEYDQPLFLIEPM